jgi:tyrosyl-tRNA synthetase
MSTVLDVLEKRGFVDQITSEELRKAVCQPLKVYCGFDPTSDSLHVGNLVALMGLAWFQKFGHTPYALVGGATGMIGDPSGKSKERDLLDPLTIQKNSQGIFQNLKTVLNAQDSKVAPVMLNNHDWFSKFSFLEFLRDVGKNFRVGVMLGKESVKSRLESSEGMSFTEFSYQTLQAYDFYYLRKEWGVNLQIGGSDQWGNITAGIEFAKKMGFEGLFGLTMPLLTTSDGKKLGKSEKGAIWLSSDKLSPYEFYQYFIRQQDADVVRLMRLLTFMDLEEITSLEDRYKRGEIEPNGLQRILASQVTEIVHGKEALLKALSATEGLQPGQEATLKSAVLKGLDIPKKVFERKDVIGKSLLDLLVESSLLQSKGEARRLIQNGGVYLNNQKIENEKRVIDEKDLIDDELLLLSSGKKNKLLLEIK